MLLGRPDENELGLVISGPGVWLCVVSDILIRILKCLMSPTKRPHIGRLRLSNRAILDQPIAEGKIV